MKALDRAGFWTVILSLLALAIMAVTFLQSYATSQAEDRARNSYLQARVQTERLNDLETALLDAETGQRGFLLTDDRKYLEPYNRAVDLFAAAQNPGSANQDMSLGQIDERFRRRIDMKLSELAETIRLADAGDKAAALELVRTDQGQILMDEIRQDVTARRQQLDQQTALASQDAVSAQSREAALRWVLAAAFFFVALSLIGVLVQAVLGHRAGSRLELAETAQERAEDAQEKTEVLAHELDHRMKNLFAITGSMISQSARGKDETVKDFASDMRGRIQAMSHAYSMTRQLDEARSMPKSEIIDRVVRAQLLDDHVFDSVGEDEVVREEAVTPLALILHEWTTNALKYGAWRPLMEDEPKPRKISDVSLSWSEAKDGSYELLWDEHFTREGSVKKGQNFRPETQGYGSRLVEMCARQIGAAVNYDWHKDGVKIRLTGDREQLIGSFAAA